MALPLPGDPDYGITAFLICDEFCLALDARLRLLVQISRSRLFNYVQYTIMP